MPGLKLNTFLSTSLLTSTASISLISSMRILECTDTVPEVNAAIYSLKPGLISIFRCEHERKIKNNTRITARIAEPAR